MEHDELDNSVQEGLQTMSLYDVEVIQNVYRKNDTPKKKEIVDLIDQMKHWNKDEKDRKWFHF